MPDDRFIIHIDRDRDGVPDETLASDPPTDSTTLQPPFIDLPPRLVQVDTLHGLHSPGGVEDGPSEWGRRDSRTRQRATAFWAFGAAALAVIALALALAVMLARLFERMLANDSAIALASMLAAICCAVGAFLGMARLTRLLNLQAANGPQARGDGRRVLAVAQLDVAYQAEIAHVLGATSDDLPATLDIVAGADETTVLLRVLDENDAQLSERRFPNVSAAQAYARDAFGVHPERWIELQGGRDSSLQLMHAVHTCHDEDA